MFAVAQAPDPSRELAPMNKKQNRKSPKTRRPKARLPKGMRDIEAGEIRAMAQMLDKIRAVYELYGFEPLDTPAFEYSDALGKFLPDQDRPNAGVFSFEDEDSQWLSLRYDLTAPLARYVALHYDALPKPFRRYQTGFVYRNEKPGPGRFRQFTQFDADTVGAPVGAADAEICMLMADVMEALGVRRGDYIIRVNNRKLLDGLMQAIGLGDDGGGGDDGSDERAATRLTVLRSLDKLDKIPREEVKMLLGPDGRKDESGAFTPGAGLDEEQINDIFRFLDHAEKIASDYYPAAFRQKDSDEAQAAYKQVHEGLAFLGENEALAAGLDELETIHRLLASAGYGDDRVRIDPSVVRGLEYYTGPVFEAELTFEVKNDKGRPVRFGSVGGGGRYDGLVERFKGVRIPATGTSIGVSRLYAALQALGETGEATTGPVVVLVMDREAIGVYQQMTNELRRAGVRTEMYVGGSGMRAQMKYADRRAAPCVVIQGSDEREAGEVTIKDLIEGAELSKQIEDNKSWREGRPAQFAVRRDELVEAVKSVLARHSNQGL